MRARERATAPVVQIERPRQSLHFSDALGTGASDGFVTAQWVGNPVPLAPACSSPCTWHRQQGHPTPIQTGTSLTQQCPGLQSSLRTLGINDGIWP